MADGLMVVISLPPAEPFGERRVIAAEDRDLGLATTAGITPEEMAAALVNGTRLLQRLQRLHAFNAGRSPAGPAPAAAQ
jgi:hypothetical protein